MPTIQIDKNEENIIVPGEQKKENSKCLADCGIKIMRSIFKVIMFIYQSKANLDVKISFGKMTYVLDAGNKMTCLPDSSTLNHPNDSIVLYFHRLCTVQL